MEPEHRRRIQRPQAQRGSQVLNPKYCQGTAWHAPVQRTARIAGIHSHRLIEFTKRVGIAPAVRYTIARASRSLETYCRKAQFGFAVSKSATALSKFPLARCNAARFLNASAKLGPSSMALLILHNLASADRQAPDHSRLVHLPDGEKSPGCNSEAQGRLHLSWRKRSRDSAARWNHSG